MTADLAADTWAMLRDHPDAGLSSPARVMEALAVFQAEPCASTWYGFISRLALIVRPWDVHRLLWDQDPFPGVTGLALADAKLAEDGAQARPVSSHPG